MLKLLDFPFRPFDAEASIHVLAVPYLFWPARDDDGADVSVYVRPSALEEVLGIVGDRPRKGSEGHSSRELVEAPASH